MKRGLAFVLSFALVFSIFGSLVFAETDALPEKDIVSCVTPLSKEEVSRGGFLGDSVVSVDELREAEPESGIGLFSTDETEDVPFEEYLEAQLRARTPHIDIYPNYMIYVEISTYTGSDGKEHYAVNISEFQKILRKILFDNYDILVLDDYDGCGYGQTSESLGYVSDFEPVYLEPEEEGGEAAALAMMDEAIDHYVDAAEDIPADDIVGKLLVIHDLFCAENIYARNEYAEEQNYGIMHNEARTAYYLFKHNRAVCQGNVIGIKAILDRLNERLKTELGRSEDIIETSFISSNSLAHVWNIVKINGIWYHLDETWADMDNENPEIAACYDFFLKSDDEFIDTGSEYISAHSVAGETDWIYYTDEEVVCGDDRYSQGYIFNKIPYSCIAYSGGMYNIPFYGYIFRSEGIIATEMLATDSFLEEYNGTTYNAVVFFTDGAVTAKRIMATYGNGGALEDGGSVRFVNNFSAGAGYGVGMTLYNNIVPTKLLLWSPETYEPLCRAIDLPPLVTE